MLRMLSLCAGIGGADLAAEWTGAIEVVGQVENDPFCQAVLAKHWPDAKRMEDIKDVQGDEFGPIDIVMGGIPCQPFSSAGKRKGTSDDRYLWPEMFRIVQRAKPTWVVIENVDDFAAMALDIVSTDLESKAYEVQAFILPACAVGAPHERQRCFVVAYSARNRWHQWGAECQEQQGELLSDWSGISQCTLADSPGRGREEQSSAGRLHNQSHPSSFMAYSSSPGRQEFNSSTIAIDARYDSRRTRAPGIVGQLKSRVGRILDGISARLDSARWPALPGQQQKDWEPPRTTAEKLSNRARRVKALGNAIVPYQIYPLFELIVAANEQLT